MTDQERYQALNRLQCLLDGHYTPFIELDWVPDRFLCLVCGQPGEERAMRRWYDRWLFVPVSVALIAVIRAACEYARSR